MGYTNHARKDRAIRRSENGIYSEYHRSCGHTFDTMGYVYYSFLGFGSRYQGFIES